jgi:hypothetical protein
MPRGRGRKRGHNQSNPPRRTIGRATSTSRPRQSTVQLSATTPRRSNRITEAYPNHPPTAPPTTDPMTDVARRTHCTQLSSRSNEANISRQRTRPRSGRSAAEPHGFGLDFVVRPPTEVQAGSPISPAVTIQVITVRRGPSAAAPDRSLHRYFAVVSLLQLYEDGDIDHASPGMLAGVQLADSIHAPDHATFTLNFPDILGYVSFPNLVIRSPGTFRLRTSLMKVGSSGGSRFLHSEDSGLIVVT